MLGRRRREQLLELFASLRYFCFFLTVQQLLTVFCSWGVLLPDTPQRFVLDSFGCEIQKPDGRQRCYTKVNNSLLYLFDTCRREKTLITFFLCRLFSGKLIEPRIIGRHSGVNSWLEIGCTTCILGHDSDHSHCSTDVLHQRRTFVAMAGASSIYCDCIIQEITLPIMLYN